MRRQARQTDGTFTLRKQEEAYGDAFSTENAALSLDNRRFWDESRGRTAI
jgi:hypothetical protein